MVVLGTCMIACFLLVSRSRSFILLACWLGSWDKRNVSPIKHFQGYTYFLYNINIKCLLKNWNIRIKVISMLNTFLVRIFHYSTITNSVFMSNKKLFVAPKMPEEF